MGHAGAIITGSGGKASEKMKALSQAGATIAPTPAEVGLTTRRILERV
jgi:succinyl-CoA synthetase alpha subunit